MAKRKRQPNPNHLSALLTDAAAAQIRNLATYTGWSYGKIASLLICLGATAAENDPKVGASINAARKLRAAETKRDEELKALRRAATEAARAVPGLK